MTDQIKPQSKPRNIIRPPKEAPRELREEEERDTAPWKPACGNKNGCRYRQWSCVNRAARAGGLTHFSIFAGIG